MSNRNRPAADDHRIGLGDPAHNPVLTSLPDMARLLGVPPKWLRAEADGGRVPCLIADGAYLFDADAVIAVIRERAAKAAQ